METINKIGLALGGGAVLGAAHVGVIKAIEEANIEIVKITGTSIGAVVACLYSFGINCKEIQKIGSQLQWLDIAGLSLSKYALLSNKKFGELIVKHIGDRNIEESNIPLAFVATDVTNGEKVVLKEGNIAKAVMASTAIPGIFEPVEIGDKLLVDGGVVENVPINTLNQMGTDFSIGVDLNSNHKYQRPGNVLEVILNSFHFLMKQSSMLQTKEADLLITPNLSAYNRSDMSQVKNVMEAGYKAAKETLKNYNNNLPQ
ncbi:MAG: patatin-like phospholipase family protein [Winogradskyella sp.]